MSIKGRAWTKRTYTEQYGRGYDNYKKADDDRKPDAEDKHGIKKVYKFGG